MLAYLLKPSHVPPVVMCRTRTHVRILALIGLPGKVSATVGFGGLENLSFKRVRCTYTHYYRLTHSIHTVSKHLYTDSAF